MMDPDLSALDAVRTRRMADSWQAGVPSKEEIEFAARRLQNGRRPPRRSPTKVLLVALVQGFVVGVGSLAAASWALNRVYPPGGGPKSATQEERLPVARIPNSLPVGAARTKPMDAPQAIPHAAFEDMKAPGRAALPATSPDTPRSPPGVGPNEAQAHDAPSDPASAPAGAGSGVAALPSLDPASGERQDGPWAKVAHALAASDWLRADQALKDLGSSRDAQTRDAAELARAELWIAHGRGDEARVTVERLARTAPTPLVRRRALALLEQLR